MVNMLRSIGEVFRPKRAVEEKETNKAIKKEVSDVKFATETATNVSDVIEYLLKLHSYKNKNEFKKHVDRTYLASLKDKFVLLKSKLDEAEKANPSIKDLAIVRFCRSIAENNELHKELSNLARKCHNDGIHKKLNVLKKYRNVPYATSYERLYPQLDKLVTNFDMHQLQKQISFLKKLKEKSDFNAIRNDYSNAWDFDDLLRDLMRDEKFRREYITKALDEEGESFSKSFKEDLNKYIELANESVKAARKCLGEEVGLQTYYTQINDTDRALNINITGRNKTEPTKISDLLQKEENTSELNIYYKKKHEVRAYRDEKERRHYEFKGDASYEMTNTWRAEDESGNTSICKMVMNVSSYGITEIVEFNGKKSGLLSKDDLKLVQQNDALYIQGLSFYVGVEKWLSSQCGESLRVTEKGKKKDTVTMPDVVPVVAGNSLQEHKAIEVTQSPNDKGTDTGLHSLSNAAAAVCNTPASEVTETSETGVGTQTEVGSPQMDELTNSKQEVSKLKKENVELKAAEEDLQVMDQKYNKLIQENCLLQKEIKATQEENKGLNQKLSVISEQDKKFKYVNGLLKDKIEELCKERDNLYEIRCGLQDELERTQQEFTEEKGLLNHRIADSQEKFVQLTRRYGELENKLAETKQVIEELEQQNNDLETKDIEIIERLEGKNARLQVEKNKMREELVQSKKEHEEKAKELDSMYEKKEKAERALGTLNKENSQLKDRVKILERDVCTAEEETLKIANERDKIEENFRCRTFKDIEAIEKLQEQNSVLKTENYEISEELAKLKKEQKEGTKELEDMREEKEKVEKKLKVLSQENRVLESRVEKSEEDRNKAEEYAEYLMDEGSKDERGFRSKMLELEQNYEERLKSSAKSVEEKEWELKELQNELGRKKEIFQKAEKAYRELEAENKKLKEDLNLQRMKNDMKEGMLNGAVQIRKDLENEIEDLQEIIAQKMQDIKALQKEALHIRACLEHKIEDLREIIADKTQDIEALQKENERLTKDIEKLSEGFSPMNGLSISDFKKVLTFTTGIGELISPGTTNTKPEQQLYRSSSVESGLGSDKENCDDRSWVERVKPSSNVAAVKS